MSGNVGRSAVSGFKDGGVGEVIDVCTGSNTNAAHLCRKHVAHIVAIEVERRNNAVCLKFEQSILKECVGDTIVDFEFSALQLFCKFALCKFITPFLEAPFCELHNVTLMHQGHGGEVVFKRIEAGCTHESLCAFLRNGLDTKG